VPITPPSTDDGSLIGTDAAPRTLAVEAPGVLSAEVTQPVGPTAWDRLVAAWNWKPFRNRPPHQRVVLEALLWVMFFAAVLHLPHPNS